MGANTGRDLKRGTLAALTLGTSEIKTGGGLYGDETVADTLFPKAINDAALDDRQTARGLADKAEADKKIALDAKRPQIGMDIADQANRAKKSEQLLKLLRGSSGRSGTFGTS